ncbi:Hypp3633 [Branchiostoma lanceolatum]|uniref:Hypp3633 protein n=1 Tax=Branchiostoma lanceolatum TaxID=7740 RepID=A0A8K0A0E3_BRALA|nr:Hypp3633 [Branchiostoma lanceolatum]
MWETILTFLSCCTTSNKIFPEETPADKHEDETMVRETAESSAILPISSPPAPIMTQPRPEKSSTDILAQLRSEGLLPGLKQRDNAVAFQVAAENPDTPPRYHMRLKKLEKRMEERREKVKKPCPESADDLKRQLSDAEVRRQDLLAKRSGRISTESAEKTAKVKAKKAARKTSSTAFIVTSTSDSDIFATRESQRTKRMERRLTERRARVSKASTAEELETRQNLAAQRRKDHVVATVSKAKKLARPRSISPARQEPGCAGN